LAATVFLLVATEAMLLAVTYVSRDVNTPAPSKMFFTIPFATCSDGTQVPVENAYIRGGNGGWTTLQIGGAASETGLCDAYLGSTLVFTQTRYMATLLYFQTPQGLLESQVGSTSASYQRQEIDTSVGFSGGWKYGSGPVNTTLGSEGDWTLREFARSFQTSCMETPTDSGDLTRHLKVQRCAPNWNYVTGQTIDIAHIPTGSVYVYVPATMSAL
jgi:hypothetical protein